MMKHIQKNISSGEVTRNMTNKHRRNDAELDMTEAKPDTGAKRQEPR